MQEFPDLKHGTRNNIMQVSKRFGGSQNFNYHFPISVLYELAAPSVPDELVEALQVFVDNQEDEREVILLVLGRTLLDGRKLNEGDREFGKWCKANFPNLSEQVSAKEVTAILWAAEFPEQHQDMLDKHSRVRTTRGLYAKWKEEQA
jgi:hypothetical protein